MDGLMLSGVAKGLKMRRTDKEVNDHAFVRMILDACERANFGFYDGKVPYVVPMNFAYEFEDGNLKLFTHSATEGRKMEIIRGGFDTVAFEMDANSRVYIDPGRACSSTMCYDSLMGIGKIRLLGGAEKKERLEKLFQEQSGTFVPMPEGLNGVEVLCLDVESFTAKRSKK